MKNGILNKIKINFNMEGLRKAQYYLSGVFARKSFKFFEKYLKLHVTPVHFYSPIPTTYELNDDTYNKIYECTGINLSIEEQLQYLAHIHSKYYDEYKPTINIDRFSQVDSFVLYSMIREKKPKVVVEVGSGESTKISLESLKMNEKEGYKFQFYAIEPYPPDFLKDVQDKNLKYINQNLQEVDLTILCSADLLFIDSSHVCKIGSDVTYEILEVIPRLKVGAVLHWHDIMMPTNYWKRWIDDGNMFWNESYMVHAFMLFNKAYKVLWASRYMQINHHEELRKRFSYFNPEDENQQITSFWIERIS